MANELKKLQEKLRTGVTAVSLENFYDGREVVQTLLSLGAIKEGNRKVISTKVKTRDGTKQATTRRGAQVYVKGKSLLPDYVTFAKAREDKYRTTVKEVVEGCFGDIEELANEMREAFDNMEGGNLGQTSRCQAYGEAADALEGIQAVDVPEPAGRISLIVYPDRSHRTGRGHRASCIIYDLTLCVEAVREAVEKNDDNAATYSKEETEAMEKFCTEIEDTINDLEGVDFPGMYG